MMRMLLLCLALLPAVAVRAETIAIVGADIHTLGERGSLRGGTVVIADGRIEAIGTGVELPAGARAIDGKGAVVTPGLFHPIGQLGLVEIELEAPTVDFAQRRDDLSAGFDIAAAINPRSTLIGVARESGVTHALVVPEAPVPEEPGQPASPLAGLGTVIDLGGPVNYRVAQRAALVAHFGTRGGQLAGGSRAAALDVMKQALADARDYDANRGAYAVGARRPYSVSAADLEALVAVADKSIPLIVEANRASDIAALVEFALTEDIRLIVSGGAEAYLVAVELAAAGVPVIIDAFANLPGSFDSLSADLGNAARLVGAGVTVAIGAWPTHNAAKLRQAAGNAVAHGLPWIEGLRAITETAPAMFGLDDDLGRLAPGAPASLVVWDGDPLEVTSFPRHVFIDGREIDAPSRQTLLR
ncbi:MAG: amidohydrolase family protein, partial [Pseudomonadota bacterium]